MAMVNATGFFMVASLLMSWQGISSAQPYQAYHASLIELDASGASGEVAIFSTSSGDLLGAGIASGLEPSLLTYFVGGGNCTAKNGCGAHVHSGYSCDNTSSQGGHFFAMSDVDPWANVSYVKTGLVGEASFTFAVSIGTTNIAGKPFVIHNDRGGRVACGLLVEVMDSVRHAALAPLGGADVTGSTSVFTTPNLVAGAGFASGLESSLSASSNGGNNCTATNGCGVHVHSGTACTNTSTQGGHYYAGSSDPWAPIGYIQTDMAGNTSFVFMITSSATDVSDKPFVIHNNAGGRVGCGILMATNSAFTETNTTTWMETSGASTATSTTTFMETSGAFAATNTTTSMQSSDAPTPANTTSIAISMEPSTTMGTVLSKANHLDALMWIWLLSCGLFCAVE